MELSDNGRTVCLSILCSFVSTGEVLSTTVVSLFFPSCWKLIVVFVLLIWRHQVQISVGTMASLVPTEGMRFSSQRNSSGNWTRKPLIFISSSWALTGFSLSRPCLNWKLMSSCLFLTRLEGRQQKTWNATTSTVLSFICCLHCIWKFRTDDKFIFIHFLATIGPKM